MNSNVGGEYFEEDDKTNVKIEKVYSKENTENIEKNLNISCNICGKNYNSQSTLKLHVQSVHERIKYSCNQCV